MATKVVMASTRESGSAFSSGSCAEAPSVLLVPIVAVAVCLAGGPHLLEAPVFFWSACSSAARRFCPEEVGRGATWTRSS